MANPQAENGHLDLAHEIVEALARIRISGEEGQVLWALFRKTYGWHKKEDYIPLSQFSVMTGLKRQTVHRALMKLSSKKMIVIKKDDGLIRLYRFNKDFEEWKPSSKKITPGKPSSILITKVSSKMMTSKETKKKTNVPTFSEDSFPLRLSVYLWNFIHKNFPKIKSPSLQRWCIPVDLMIRVDDRAPDDIARVIEWCQKDDFWKKNILSTEKLRKQFDTIQARMGGLK